MLKERGHKKGQVTIFIIVAIVLLVGIVGYFLLKDKFTSSGLPAGFEPVYTTFLQCVDDEAKVGIDTLESQGGYIELPNFEAGSAYSPFGSQLYFLDNPIPYWYYVSGNNIEKEQVPSVSDMEKSLGDYLENNLQNCIYDSYYDQGFEINQGEPKVDVDINNEVINVDIDMDFGITKDDESVLIKDHNVQINSNLGGLYEAAREVYDYEQSTLFLEDYGVDVLNLYAPVNGAELTCSPLTWNAEEIFSTLREALEANTGALKVEGGDYDLNEDNDKYFVVDLDVGKDVRFLTSRNWSMSFEVSPADSNLLIENPVGNQQVLGVLGFCYVAYHFVYNVNYPVLVQIYDGEEVFQFPVAVRIQGNQPRESRETTAFAYEDDPLCEYQNTPFQVETYDSRGSPIDAKISFECFGEKCEIGETENGVLTALFPQCANGNLIATSEGYADKKQVQTIVEEGNAQVFLNKLHDLDVNLKIDGRASNSYALISFVSDSSSSTIVYPETKNVELSEGQYEISVYTYEESSLNLEGYSTEQCVEVPREGLGALFGLTDEKCFEVDVPDSIVSNALAGGGKQSHYILEEELASSSVIEIDADRLQTPKTIEDLQENYLAFENNGLDIELK